METSNIIASCALGLSVIALSSQAIGSYRRRGKVIVKASVGHETTFVGTIERVPQVTVSAVNQPAGIESILLEFVGEKVTNWSMTPHSRLTYKGGRMAVEQPTYDPLLEGTLGTRTVLQAGAARTWAFRVQMVGHPGVDKPRQMKAVVTLTNGKKYRSEPFELHPNDVPPRPDDEAPPKAYDD